MVIYSKPSLDRTFAALSDPTRRGIVERLAGGDSLAVSELAAPLAMSLPAVLKHVAVLADAGLVAREKVGRTVYCRLEAAPMRAALDWLEHYERFWSERLGALARFVEQEETPACPDPKPNRKPRASRSAGRSRRRRRGSGAPGPRRKR